MAQAHADDEGTGSSQARASRRNRGTGARSDGATDTPVPGFATRRITRVARHFACDAGGATAIEYALIAGLIFMVVTGSIRLYSSRMNTVYGQITGAMSQVN